MTTAPSPEIPPAVLLGIDSMQGLQAARILAGHGVPVIAYAGRRGHHATFTRVCEEIRYAGSSEELLADLERLGRTLTSRAVLIPCIDGKVLTISKARATLSRWYEIVLPEHDVVEMMMDKARFLRFAEENGFPVPRSRTVRSRVDVEEAATELRFPMVIKPSYRSTRWTSHTTDKAYEVMHRSDLIATWERIQNWADELIVQEWIRGGVEELYSCNVYISRQGEVLASFVARKLRQWPVDTGQSALGEECRNDVVEELTLSLLSAVSYRGLGYVEVKRDAVDGRYRIVEPNVGRPTGRSAIAEGGGVPLLYTMYCDAAGLPLPADREQTYTGVKWIHLRRDLQAAIVLIRRGDLGLWEWARSLRGRKVYAVFSVRDPLPFVLDVVEAVRKGLRRGRTR
jgi:predicted ATP-grasp superfamily ATP-dependent carboligase